MNGKHGVPGSGGGRRSRRRARRDGSPALWLAWGLMGLALVLSVIAAALALSLREKAPETPAPTAVPGPGSAFVVEHTMPPVVFEEGTRGRSVEIRGFKCDFTPPEELTAGVLRGVDISAVGSAAAENAAAAGWGELSWSGDAGTLVLRAGEEQVLTAADFEQQAAFLSSSRPEDLARTFLDNSGLITLLRPYGLSLSTQVENNGGEIVFRGVGNGPQSECSVRVSFLYTGQFHRALVRAEYLDGAVTTREVTPPAKAADRAVTWNTPASDTPCWVVGVELRSVQGLPFYVFTCDDGTVAYALAVEESVLGRIEGARTLYTSLMDQGIREFEAPAGVE